MAKSPFKTIMMIFILNIILSLIDGFTGFFANIPLIGGIVASLSNVVIESIQGLLNLYGAFLVGRYMK